MGIGTVALSVIAVLPSASGALTTTGRVVTVSEESPGVLENSGARALAVASATGPAYSERARLVGRSGEGGLGGVGVTGGNGDGRFESFGLIKRTEPVVCSITGCWIEVAIGATGVGLDFLALTGVGISASIEVEVAVRSKAVLWISFGLTHTKAPVQDHSPRS